MSPVSNRFPTNSCVTGKFAGSLVHLLIDSGLHPFRNWEPKKRSFLQCSAALGTSPIKLVNTYNRIILNNVPLKFSFSLSFGESISHLQGSMSKKKMFLPIANSGPNDNCTYVKPNLS